MTPNLDSIAIEFIKRIPTTFKSAFTAGRPYARYLLYARR